MGERAWVSEPNWGIAKADLALVPTDINGQTAIDLGYGTAYWSAWMHRLAGRALRCGLHRPYRDLRGVDWTVVEIGFQSLMNRPGNIRPSSSER